MQVVGVWNPRYLTSFYRESGEDEGRVPSWLVHSNLRAFCWFSSMLFIFHILFSLFILLTNAFKWPSGRRAGMQPLGPGFDSQVHPIFVSIFHNIIMCRHSKVFHHIPQTIRRKVATCLNLMAMRCWPWRSLVNHALDKSESQTGMCASWASVC